MHPASAVEAIAVSRGSEPAGEEGRAKASAGREEQ
jgi:hypothetical protein